MIPETDLEQRILHRVRQVKETIPGWNDPKSLAHSLGIRVAPGRLGTAREGAAVDGLIVLDEQAGVPSRVRFTFYHEIMHHLIREDDELYSVLHDQYEDADELSRISERLANTGAAEFLVPRESVLEAAKMTGFSLSLFLALEQASPASRTAVCVQIGLCAPHRCVALVARHTEMGADGTQASFLPTPARKFAVEVAVSSRTMKYGIAKGTPIPQGHLLRDALESEEGRVVKGKDRIPFRNRGTAWPVDCEAIRIGQQVFALFHADAPPVATANQIRFDF